MKGDATERRVECGEKGGKKEVQKERKKERKKKQKTKRATKHTDMTIVRRFCGFFFFLQPFSLSSLLQRETVEASISKRRKQRTE